METLLRFIDFLLDTFGAAFDWLLQPIHKEGTNRALTAKNLEASLRKSGVSQMLPYKLYSEIDGIGIYTGDGEWDDKGRYKGDRHGFILRVQGDAFPNNIIQERVSAFLKSINREGVVVNFFNMASQNIEPQINAFEAYHQCNVNVKNVSFLKKLISNRAAMLRRWTRESMFEKKGGDFRLKEFVSLVSVLFPEDVEIDDIIAEYGTLKSALGMESRNCDAEELVTILREFFHNEKDPEDWMHGKDDLMAINKQIVGGGLKISLDTDNPRINFEMNEATKVAVLTTKRFPKRIDFSKFNSLFYDRTEVKGTPPISSPFISTLTLVYDNQEVTTNKAVAKLKHDQEQLAGLPMKKLKKNPALKDRRKETEDALELIKDGERILQGMFNIIIFDTEENSVVRSVDKIRASFSEAGWDLVQESFDHTAFSQTIFSLPLQFREEAFEYLERFDMLYRGNFSGIAPIISDTKGFFKNYHIPYFSATGQLQWFDPYASDTNYSIATAGDSGSGKSYTFADFAALNLAAGYQVRIIDSLPSYKRITNMIGGQYEDFTDLNVCANFFTNILVKKDKNGEVVYEEVDGKKYEVIDNDEMQTLIPIVGMLAGVNLQSIQSEDIEGGLSAGVLRSVFENAIRKAWRRRGREAGMQEVYEVILDMAKKEKELGNVESFNRLHKVTNALSRYSVKGGSGYSFFNGVNTIEMKYDLATFELTALDGQGVLYEAFLMLLANKIVNEFFENKARPKCLIIDEFWRYKETPIVLKFIEELARKARKASGFIVPITQAITDYYSSQGMENIANSCAFKWILQQDPSVIEKAKAKGNLPYSNFLINQIGKIHNNPPLFGEFAIMNGAYSLFTRLKTDRISHWLYTTHPSDNQKMSKVAKQFGITELEASLFCAFKETFEHATDEEALAHATTKEDDNWDKYRKNEEERNKKISNLIKQTVTKDDKALEIVEDVPRYISGKNKGEEKCVWLSPHLRFGIDELLEPDAYRFLLDNTSYSATFMDMVIEKCIDSYDASRWDEIVIDISTKAFFMPEHIASVLRLIEKTNKKYLLKVAFKEMSGEQAMLLPDILKQLENKGVGLILSSVSETTPIILYISGIVKGAVFTLDEIEKLERLSAWMLRLLNEHNIPIIVESEKELYEVPEILSEHNSVFYIRKKLSFEI